MRTTKSINALTRFHADFKHHQARFACIGNDLMKETMLAEKETTLAMKETMLAMKETMLALKETTLAMEETTLWTSATNPRHAPMVGWLVGQGPRLAHVLVCVRALGQVPPTRAMSHMVGILMFGQDPPAMAMPSMECN